MWNKFKLPVNNDIFLIVMRIIQRASEADYQSCSIEISDIYIYMYVYVRQNISPALLIT